MYQVTLINAAQSLRLRLSGVIKNLKSSLWVRAEAHVAPFSTIKSETREGGREGCCKKVT